MTPAARSQLSQQAPESLRERKKRLTREAIFAAARALFGERGFDDVTVAEIADAANISVKTLFTYIGSKEELLFSGRPTVLDAVVEAVRNRKLAQTPLVAAAQALLAAVDDEDQDRNIDAFLRMAASGPAARSRLRALWDETEDALAEALATRKDGPARAGRAAADRRPDHGPRPHRHQHRGRRPHRQGGGHGARAAGSAQGLDPRRSGHLARGLQAAAR